MCGIGGYYGLFPNELLHSFTHALQHRGPDDCGIWNEDNVGLMHTRLSIIDLSKSGHQPMSHENLVITYNGEIYNYKELRQKLIEKGEVFSSDSDTEVVLKMYKHYGTSCLQLLNGIFAFALWDIKEKILFVARDHLGVKPFYYAFTANGFLFSSELKALLCSDAINLQLDPVGVAGYLTYLWSPGEMTMIEEIKKLEPGCAMLIKHGQLEKKWRFYDISYKTKHNISEHDAILETRRLVDQAVSRQMLADVQIGAFLSGGLDSSAVVAYAKNSNPSKPFQCFTIDLQCKNNTQDGFVDDLPYAKKVAKFLNVDLNIVTVNSNILNYLEKMIYNLDEPQGDPAALNVLLISQLAKEHGIKVLLSGAGGDDIFTGYRRHYAINYECYWKWLPQAIRKKIQWLSRQLPQQYSFSRRLSKAFHYAGFEESARLVSYFYWLDPKWLPIILSNEILAKLEDFNPAQPLLTTLANLNNEVGVVDRMLYLECKHFLADHNLNYTDKMGMAAGVEIRVPLLDLDLIEFVTNLPEHYKQRGRESKWIFKKAMEGVLPHDIIYRPKTGFGAPLRYWLRNELKGMVNDMLSVANLAKVGIFNPLGVEKLLLQDSLGVIDASYPIFTILCIQMWHQIFVSNTRTKASSQIKMSCDNEANYKKCYR